jgi:hypothetical protein
MKQGRYEDALKRLEGSKEYPARLGTGKPHDPDYRVQDYLMAFTYEKMGKGAQAADAQKRIVEYLARNSRGGAGTVSARVNQWYATTFPAQNELQALKDLMKIVQGNRRRHED